MTISAHIAERAQPGWPLPHNTQYSTKSGDVAYGMRW